MRKSLNLLDCFIVFLFSFIFISSMKNQMPGTGAVPGMQSLPDIPFPPLPSGDDSGLTPTVSPNQVAPEITPAVIPLPGQTQTELPAGPETVNFSEEKIGTQGNWIKKREWLKEAQKVNMQAQEFAATIQKSRKTFTDKFAAIDNDLDTFYKQEGLARGKIEDLFDSLKKYLEKKKEKVLAELKAENEAGVTTEYQIKLDLIEDELAADKKDLEQLKLDMKSIEDLDKSVALRLKTLDEQIKIASDQSMKSKKLFDEIWYIIDDKKARASYYELNGNIFERIKTIKSYIENDLSRDFDNVLGVIRSQIVKVKGEIKDLESKGLIVRNRAERIKDIKLKELEPAPPGLQTRTLVQEAKKLEKKTWYTNLYDSIVDSSARSYIKVKKFFGLKLADEKQQQAHKTIPMATPVNSLPIDQMPTSSQMGEVPPPPVPLPQASPLPVDVPVTPGSPGSSQMPATPVDSGLTPSGI